MVKIALVNSVFPVDPNRQAVVHAQQAKRHWPVDQLRRASFAVHGGERRAGQSHRSHDEVEGTTPVSSTIFRIVCVSAIDHAVVEIYGRVRTVLENSGTTIGALDTFIAAPALTLGATLVTSNTKEFARVPDCRSKTGDDSVPSSNGECPLFPRRRTLSGVGCLTITGDRSCPSCPFEVIFNRRKWLQHRVL